MKNLTTPKRKSGEKSTGSSCSLPASATSEGSCLQDTLLAFQANHKSLVKHVVQVASSLAEVHKQLNQLCTRSILNEKRIDSLEEGVAKMAASICELNKKLMVVSNEAEVQTIHQISAELEDQTSHQISAGLDQPNCQCPAKLEVQPSCQCSAELEDQASCQCPAKLEDQTNRQISAGLEDPTSHQKTPELEDQTSFHSSAELEDQTSFHSSNELECQTSFHSSVELEHQTSFHSSAELKHQTSFHSSAELEDQTSFHSSAELEHQTSFHSSAELEHQTSFHSSVELEHQTSFHSSADLEHQTSFHSSAELKDQTSRQISVGVEDHTSHQRIAELEAQTSYQTSLEVDERSCQTIHDIEDETMLQSSAGYATPSADGHKPKTNSAENAPTPETDEKFDSFQVLQHRAEWKKLSSQQYSLASYDNTKYCKPRSPVMQKIQTEEEELQYLQFVADVTNEILTLGLFSNRVLERVFERHVEQNRHRLEENKMRHLLQVLREDLGCNTEGPDNVDNQETRSFLHQEKPKVGVVHNAVPRNKCREKTTRRTKILSGEQQKQMEQLLQKECVREPNGRNSRQQFLSEGDQQELHVESVYQHADRSIGPLSLDLDVDGLSADMDPLSLDLYSELEQSDGDMNFQLPSLDVDNHSSTDHEEKSDATQNLDVSDCATEPDSDTENLDESTGMEHLERYFADSLSYCKNEDECPLDLSGGRRANPSKTTLADYESEREQFFK